jgi:2-dehydro-3-deoxygluconokinase
MNADVIALGEAMVRLSPPSFRRLEQANSLDVEVGGAELNTSVGLARLGRRIGWVSRLTDNPLGRLIANRARETGVATDHIVWTPHDRVGLYFLEAGAAPRPSGIVYDRAGSAVSKIDSTTFDWATIFAGARWFYVTGITAALGESAATATLDALRIAKSMGLQTCLDPNYRAKLWSVENAAAWLAEAIRSVDVLVTNPEDLKRFFGIDASQMERGMADAVGKYQLRAIAMTLRQTPSVWRNTISAVGFTEGLGVLGGRGGGQFLSTASHDVEIVDRLGSGDAFVSGLLHGLLDDDLQKGLDFGASLSALKHSVPGDFPWITKDEVEGLLQGGGLRIRR